MTTHLSDLYNSKIPKDFSEEMSKVTSVGTHFIIDSIKPSKMPGIEVKKATTISYPTTDDEIKKIVEKATPLIPVSKESTPITTPVPASTTVTPSTTTNETTDSTETTKPTDSTEPTTSTTTTSSEEQKPVTTETTETTTSTTVPAAAVSTTKIWQVDPKLIKITGFDQISEILEKINDSLGLAGEKVKANLNKLVILEKGSSLPTPKELLSGGVGGAGDGKQFASLFVSFGDNGKGGDIVIKHSGREDKVSLDNTDSSQIKFCAFYSDCDYEIQELTEGTRILLVYSLLKTGKRSAASTAADQQQQALVSDLIKSQNTIKSIENRVNGLLNQSEPSRFISVFENTYPPTSLSFKKLKGKDQTNALLFQRIAKSLNAHIFLGTLNITESGFLALDQAKSPDIPKSSLGEAATELKGDPQYKFQIKLVEFSGSLSGVEIHLKNGELYPQDSLQGTKLDKKTLVKSSTPLAEGSGTPYEKYYHRSILVILKSLPTKEEQEKEKQDQLSAQSSSITNGNTTTTTTSTTASEPHQPSSDDSQDNNKRIKTNDDTKSTTSSIPTSIPVDIQQQQQSIPQPMEQDTQIQQQPQPIPQQP